MTAPGDGDGGRVVRVATARHQAEAEFLQGLLAAHDIRSMVRRTQGFDVPDMLASGPRDILVDAADEASAREVLRTEDAAPAQAEPSMLRVALMLAACLVVVALVVGLGFLSGAGRP